MTLHLQALLKERSLEYDEQGKVYKITTRRLQFLEMYTKIAEVTMKNSTPRIKCNVNLDSNFYYAHPFPLLIIFLNIRGQTMMLSYVRTNH
jgi:hypothetical protein